MLRLSEAVRHAEAVGLNPTSATIYVLRSPVVQTVGRRRYSLRGHARAAEQPGVRAA